MKGLIVGLIVLLFFSGCKNEILPPSNTVQDGKIILKIDRQNAPQNITTVTAYLTRPNFNTVTGTLNLLTDSTADLSLQAIPAGQWHLKVDALDSAGVVKYSGETGVNVIENQTIQVTLTLVPVSSGIGNIYLYVTWGNLPGAWIDFPGNPVITGINNAYEENGIFQSKVLFDDNKFKMWFSGLNPGGIGCIEYAESMDGINWIRPVNHPVLQPTYGTWDQYSVISGAVIKEDGVYKLYYSGRESEFGGWHIGLAVSQDGINFTKHPVPVLFAGSGWEQKIAPSDIVKKDSLFYLYYDGIVYNYPGSSMYYKIGVATSTDGITFIKSNQNPIMYATQPWEGPLIRSGSVIYENGLFTMVYMNDVNNNPSFIWGFGKATSADGINWTKASDNPFITAQNTSNHWTNWIGVPHFRKYNGEYRIYYSAYFFTSVYYKIGFMKSN